MAPKGKRKVDCTWEHCSRVYEAVDSKNDNSRLKLKCNYCGNEYWGGISRMKHHLARTRKNVASCEKVPENVLETFRKFLEEMNGKEFMDGDLLELSYGDEQIEKFVLKEKGKKQVTLNSIVKDRISPCMDICRFFYGHALPFYLVKSPLFHKMIDSAIKYGKGLELPTYHEIRVNFLKREVENINAHLEKYKIEWKKTGCTLMSDGWTDGRGRSITNFLVNSPKGTVFLKSMDTSSICKDANNLFKLLDLIVEEIGEENVVQVVTDSASAYVAAGDLLMEKRKKLFWSPYAAHLIDLMLSDIGELPVYKDTLDKAKAITKFIYHHAWVLDLMRQYTKKRELARPGVTRFATAFLTLKSLFTQKQPLRAMFASEEWNISTYAKKSEAKKVEELVLGNYKFWAAIKYCLKGVLPLVKVLRLVDGDAKPAMGYIFEAMDRAKDQIAKNFDNVRSRYNRIWTIIDTRWELQLHRPLHATAYYLNPK